MNRLLIVLIVALAFSSCDFFSSQKPTSQKAVANPDGTYIQKKHFNNNPSSPVEWEVSLKKDGQGATIRHGVSIRYSKTGKLYEKINYANNKKEGKRYSYYTDGKVWKEQEYKNGKLEGTCKRYDRNGLISAEYYYKGGLPGVGLKEFTNLGKERIKPTLKLQEIDDIKSKGQYRIKASLVGEGAERVKSVEFYQGDLVEGKFFHKNLTISSSHSGKTGTFSYNLPQGAVLNKTFNFVAVATMTSGRKQILQKKLSVSVRGV